MLVSANAVSKEDVPSFLLLFAWLVPTADVRLQPLRSVVHSEGVRELTGIEHLSCGRSAEEPQQLEGENTAVSR